ncbi:MAG: leucine-rich repeat domain-containing protein [Candidatus Thorarchaeota archaeon]
MQFTPRVIYENYRRNNIDKKKTIDLLISIIENIDDVEVRDDCIEILNKLDFKNKKLFKILENILISDENENLRYTAAKIIKSKFLKNALVPFLWALQHESSYNCLIIIIKTLKELHDKRINTTLICEIKKAGSKIYSKLLDPFLEKINCGEIKSHNLVEILINYTTLKFLKEKFNKLEFKMEDGYVTELDFSKVDNQTIYWRDKCALQDHNDILGIKNFNQIKKITFFSLGWIFSNELTFMSSLALIQAIERIKNEIAKKILITQLNNICHENSNSLRKATLKSNGKLESLSISKLSVILRNFLTISFIKRKYPSVEYKIKQGEIVKLQLENISLITIPEYFMNFRALQTLVLKRCKLYVIPEFIGSLIKLELIDLDGNNLKTIPKSISQLQSLRFLNLSNNQIEDLPSTIGELNSLEHLNLNSNMLKKLPRSIGYINSLKILIVERNNLVTIPASIGLLKSLKLLNLNSNKLDSLPHAIGLLYSLEILKLSNNNLGELPHTINSISKLKFLEIEENNLLHLTKSIEFLKSLEILKLGWNQLEKLPKSIGSLVSLKYLNLTSNKLQRLPKSICSLPFIEFLEISFNKIKVLPKTIGNLKSLKILKMGDNQLKELPDSFCLLASLEILNISGNMLKHIPKSIGMLKSLKQLWLNGNKLYYLPDSIGNLVSLEKLNLNNNYIFSLPKSMRKIQSLKEISLNSNNIECIFYFPIISNKYKLKENFEYECSRNSIEKVESIEKFNGKPESHPELEKSNIVFDLPLISKNLTFKK